jgi:hypothetical protein
VAAVDPTPADYERARVICPCDCDLGLDAIPFDPAHDHFVDCEGRHQSAIATALAEQRERDAKANCECCQKNDPIRTVTPGGRLHINSGRWCRAYRIWDAAIRRGDA